MPRHLGTIRNVPLKFDLDDPSFDQMMANISGHLTLHVPLEPLGTIYVQCMRMKV